MYYDYFQRLCIIPYLKNTSLCDHPCKMCDPCSCVPRENHHCDIANEYSKIRWMDALVMHSERNKGADGSAVLFSHLHWCVNSSQNRLKFLITHISFDYPSVIFFLWLCNSLSVLCVHDVLLMSFIIGWYWPIPDISIWICVVWYVQIWEGKSL